jgi:hypothetical protein
MEGVRGGAYLPTGGGDGSGRRRRGELRFAFAFFARGSAWRRLLASHRRRLSPSFRLPTKSLDWVLLASFFCFLSLSLFFFLVEGNFILFSLALF